MRADSAVYTAEWAIGATNLPNFYFPNSAVIDGEGRLIVADTEHQRIVAYDISNPSQPQLLATFGHGLLDPKTNQPAVDAYGNPIGYLPVRLERESVAAAVQPGDGHAHRPELRADDT